MYVSFFIQGCPLPKSKDKSELWLPQLYGDHCVNRKKAGYKNNNVAPTFRQRQNELSQRTYMSCEKLNYPVNGRMPLFQFLCVFLDNSLATFHYNSRPSKTDLIDISAKISQIKYTWIVNQTFYNNCRAEKNLEPESETELTDERYLFLRRVRELFLQTPIERTKKETPNHELYPCLRYYFYIIAIILKLP